MRISIEEAWWSDLRRSKLIKILGDEDLADAAAVRMWRLAQEFWKDGKRLVPVEIWEHFKHGKTCIEAGLAVVRDAFVYVRGSSQYLTWAAEQRENARKAGKKSAEVRAAKNGTAQPTGGKGSKPPEISEQEPNANGTESNGTELSGSGSGSGFGSGFGKNSSSENFENRMNPENQVFLERLRSLEIDSPQTLNAAAKIRDRFGVVEKFDEWVDGIAESKTFKDKDTVGGKKRYLAGALLKEIGAIE